MGMSGDFDGAIRKGPPSSRHSLWSTARSLRYSMSDRIDDALRVIAQTGLVVGGATTVATASADPRNVHDCEPKPLLSQGLGRLSTRSCSAFTILTPPGGNGAGSEESLRGRRIGQDFSGKMVEHVSRPDGSRVSTSSVSRFRNHHHRADGISTIGFPGGVAHVGTFSGSRPAMASVMRRCFHWLRRTSSTPPTFNGLIFLLRVSV